MSDDPAELLKEIKKQLDEWKPLMDSMKPEPGMETSPAEMAHYRSLALSESEGHALGREVEAHHQRHALNFARTLMMDLLTGSIAQGGISHYYKFLNQKAFPWRLAIGAAVVGFVGWLVINSPSSVGLAQWAGQGYNGYGLMIFFVAMLVLVVFVIQRRSQSSRRPVA